MIHFHSGWLGKTLPKTLSDYGIPDDEGNLETLKKAVICCYATTSVKIEIKNTVKIVELDRSTTIIKAICS